MNGSLRCISQRFVAMGLSSVLGLALISAALGTPAAAQAPKDAATGKLQSIQVTGSARYKSDQIVAMMGLHLGALVTRADLQNAANFLAQLGPFSSVQYRYASTGAGVAVQYEVKDGPTVPVWFDNFPWFSDKQLSAAVKNSVSLFDGAAPDHGTILDSMSGALERLLAAHGMPLTVSHMLATAPSTGQRVQEFRVENTPLTLASVKFTDALAQNDRGIHTLLRDLVGKPYSRMDISLFLFEQVRPVYLSHAFLQVHFGAVKAQMIGGEGSSRVAVVVPVMPGPAVTWQGVTFQGTSAISEEDLDRLVRLKPGDPANGMKIDATWDAVRAAYAQRGYLDAKLDVMPQFDESMHRIAYTVSINEGPQYHMGRLVLSGLSVEGEKRIRAAWKIAPAAVFDKSVYDQFLATGIHRAFAGLPAQYDKIGRYLQKNPKTKTVDVLLDFQ